MFLFLLLFATSISQCPVEALPAPSERFSEPSRVFRHPPLGHAGRNRAIAAVAFATPPNRGGRSTTGVARPRSPSVALGSSPSGSSPSTRGDAASASSPWCAGEWKIMMDFGRETAVSEDDGSDLFASSSSVLGEDWGSSGARLSLSLRIVVSPTEEEGSAGGRTEGDRMRDLWLGGRSTGSIRCAGLPEGGDEDQDEAVQASYINDRGLQKVRFSGGGWRIEPPQPSLAGQIRSLPGQACTVKWILTVRDALERNDVVLPEDTRLFLKSNGWRRSDYEEGQRTARPYRMRRDEAQNRLEQQVDHDTGDRRLDGTDLMETMGGYKDLAGLVLERDEARRRWKEVEGMLPEDDWGDGSRGAQRREERWGRWPGDTEPFTMERGVLIAAVRGGGKAKQSPWFPWMPSPDAREEMVVVGKWTAVLSE